MHPRRWHDQETKRGEEKKSFPKPHIGGKSVFAWDPMWPRRFGLLPRSDEFHGPFLLSLCILRSVTLIGLGQYSYDWSLDSYQPGPGSGSKAIYLSYIKI